MPVTPNDVVIIQTNQFINARATIVSLWKSGFIGDTFVRGRSTLEKFERSFAGDVAKLCLKLWLESKGLTVIDWDDVRTSWRTQKKDFDLQVNNHNIEIRSSFAENLSISDIIQNKNIIQPCNVRTKEITVQVYFPSPVSQEVLLCGWTLKNDLENPALRSPRRVGQRLVDFYLMPFSHPGARPMADLITHLLT